MTIKIPQWCLDDKGYFTFLGFVCTFPFLPLLTMLEAIITINLVMPDVKFRRLNNEIPESVYWPKETQTLAVEILYSQRRPTLSPTSQSICESVLNCL